MTKSKKKDIIEISEFHDFGGVKMIITFFGHRSLNHTGELFKKIQTVLWEQIDGHESVKFYCGGYGDFDLLCAEACRIVKNEKTVVK